MAKWRLITILTVLFAGMQANHLSAQTKPHKIRGINEPIICYMAEGPAYIHIPPPEFFDPKKKAGQEGAAQFNIELTNSPSAFAQVAADYTAAIWSSIIYSDIPINVSVEFVEYPPDKASALASTYPDGPYMFEENGSLPGRLYYAAIYEKLTKRNWNGNQADIIIDFNNEVDWYFGTDGNPGQNQFDFVSTLLHEIGHGLGFYGYFRELEDKIWYIYKTPAVFDHFIQNVIGESLTDTLIFPVPSTKLTLQLQGNLVFFQSPLSIQHAPDRPLLHTPNPWEPGSSLYHLDNVYNDKNGGRDALMTSAAPLGEVIHDPGPVLTFMMYELGWVHTFIEHDTLLDRETLDDPFTVTAKIYGDKPVKPSTQYLVWSFNGFVSRDSLAMTPTGNPDEYAADIPVGNLGTTVDYYIRSVDSLDRLYTMPPVAPENTYSFHAGPDNTFPKIEHKPVPFMILGLDSVRVQAEIWDNLGVDVAEVVWKINGTDQTAFNLAWDTLNNYNGYFRFSDGQLSANDVISYRIKAVDGAVAANTSFDPVIGSHEFDVIKLPPAQDEYQNDFESDIDDFFPAEGWERLKPEGFSSYGLHSEHPYPESGEDKYENYSMQLKVPIRLRPDDAFMTFNEVVLVEPGDPGTVWGDENFYDYVMVEGSKDGGASWHEMEIGRDCRTRYYWDLYYNQEFRGDLSTYVATQENVKPKKINMLSNPVFENNDIVLIRFRLHSDPYANGWGWMIDDLQIQGPVTSEEHHPMVRESIEVYPNPSTGIVTVNLQMNDNPADLQITLLDMTGKEIFREHYRSPGSSFIQNFHLEDLREGLYLMRFQAGRQSIHKKILIAR